MNRPHFFLAHPGLRQYFALFLLAGLTLLSNGTPVNGQASGNPQMVEYCTQPGVHCIFLPTLGRDLDPRIRADSRLMYQDMYLVSKVTDVGWTGGNIANCQAGSISQAYRDAVLLRVNYYRLMAGVRPLEGFDDNFNQQAQAAALMMSAKGAIDYRPVSGSPCYTDLGNAGARNSIMLQEHNGPDVIDIYMNDSYWDTNYNTYPVGHRRYLLYPQTLEMGDGEIPANSSYKATSVLRVWDDNYYTGRPATRNEFVAWPTAAYVPYQVVNKLWSFSYLNADFSQAQVSVTGGGTAVNVTRYPSQSGWGENTLVWSVGSSDTWPRPAVDTAYKVNIQNVIINGQPRSFTYTVTIFDPGL